MLNTPNSVAGDSATLVAGLMSWIEDPNSTQHCTITGGPGAGKTHMLREFVKVFAQYNKLNMISKYYDFQICGTTNDTLSIIKSHVPNYNVHTIYSLLGLIPVKGVIHKRVGNAKFPAGYKWNSRELRPNTNKTPYLIWCDESNYVTKESIELINYWFPKARVIWVGSKHQLGTGVGESVVFQEPWDTFELATKFRASNTEVQTVYDNSEQDVIQKNNPVTYTENDSVVYLSQADWEATVQEAYTSSEAEDCITLAYTNKRVAELVRGIRQAKGLTGLYDKDKPTQVLRAGSGKIPKKNPQILNDGVQEYIPVKTTRGILRSYIAHNYQHTYDKPRNRNEEVHGNIPSLIYLIYIMFN